MDLSAITQFDWQTVVDYLAVAIGAVTGALYASARKLDVIGTVTVGLVAAYGGGIIRDTLLQTQGFFFMQHGVSIVICAAIGVAVFLFGKYMRKADRTLFLADALSMSWFALAGASKAWASDVGVVLTVVLGAVTAVGGGVLRDACTGETPAIFKAGNFYAISAILGSSAYVICELAHAPEVLSSATCIAASFTLTLLSRHFNWRTTPSRE